MANWQKVKIASFLKERTGRYDPADEDITKLKRLDKIDFSGNIHLSNKSSKTDMIVIKPGDLVISGINVAKGALAVYRGKEPITATIHYSSYIFDESQIDIGYFRRFVRSQSFRKALKDQVKGGIKTEIKPSRFLSLDILLPDLISQKEVVCLFKNIEKEIENLNNELEYERLVLKQLRQKILQEAIEGKLTASWRSEHPELISGDNHASKLLEKIKAEKERLTKEGKVKKDKPVAPIADNEKPFELPEGWVWARFQEITKIITCGIASTPQYYDEGKMFLSAKNIKPYQFMPKDHKFVDENTYQLVTNNAKPEKKDILMTRVGAGIGESAIIDRDIDFAYYVSLTLIKLFHEFLSPQYILHFLNSSYGIKNAISYTTGTGSSQGNLNVNKVRPYLIPLPPYLEQLAIVEGVDKFIGIIEELTKQVSESKELSEMLMQSVLREAFETS